MHFLWWAASAIPLSKIGIGVHRRSLGACSPKAAMLQLHATGSHARKLPIDTSLQNMQQAASHIAASGNNNNDSIETDATKYTSIGIQHF